MFAQAVTSLAALSAVSAFVIPRNSNFTTVIPASFNSTTYQNASAPICTYFNRTFSVNSNNTIYPLGQPADQAKLTTLFTDQVSQNSNFSQEYPVSIALR